MRSTPTPAIVTTVCSGWLSIPRTTVSCRSPRCGGLPVLAWEEVPQGTLRLLCEARGVLIPQVDTCQELLDRWNYHLERPASSEDSLAA